MRWVAAAVDHTICTNNGVLPEAYARQYCGTYSDPGSTTDLDRYSAFVGLLHYGYVGVGKAVVVIAHKNALRQQHVAFETYLVSA